MADQITDQVRAAQGIPTFTTHRTLDPVRGAALEAAVRLKSVIPVPKAEEVIALAKEFEAYLTGEEADGAS
jgi:hypothetical protein